MKKIILFFLCFLCLIGCSTSKINNSLSFINESETTHHFDLGKELDQTLATSNFTYKQNQKGFELYTENLEYRYVFTKHSKLGAKEVLTYFYTCDEDASLLGTKIGEPTEALKEYLLSNGFKLIPHKKGTSREIYFVGSNKYCWLCYESDTIFINFSYNFNSGKAELHKFQIGIL